MNFNVFVSPFARFSAELVIVDSDRAVRFHVASENENKRKKHAMNDCVPSENTTVTEEERIPCSPTCSNNTGEIDDNVLLSVINV